MTSYRIGLALMLLVSGACGLVFQSTWLREFRLIFGGSTPATAAVLAVFMGGLGVGNAIFGSIAERSKNPLRLYALLEGGIAISAMLSPFALQLAMVIYTQLGGQSALGNFGATVVRLGLAIFVMGIPTILMGGTLPAVAKAVTTQSDVQRRWLAAFYGLNTLGAVLGTLLAAFVLLERLGHTATLFTACAANLLLAIAAWLLSSMPAPMEAPPKKTKRERKRERDVLTDYVEQASEEVEETVRLPMWSIYLTAAVCGCVFFLMELVWDRMLTPLLGGSTFTFAVILATVLLGIGIGGLLYPVVARWFGVTPRLLAIMCAAQALAIAIPFALGDRVALFAAWTRSSEVMTFLTLIRGWFLVTSVVVLPTATIAGMQFPILAALLGRASQDVSRQYGWLVFWNTTGSIVGALAGGFGLIPLLTATGAWRASVMVMVLLGVIWAMVALRKAAKYRGTIAAITTAAIAAGCLLSIGPTAFWRHSGIGAGRLEFKGWAPNQVKSTIVQYGSETVWEADGVESSVAIRQTDGLSLLVNGKSDGNAFNDRDTQIMLGLIAPLLREGLGESLVVGLGTGETAGWLAECPDSKRVDVVELEPAVGEMAHRCRDVNFDVMKHSKVKMIYNDAREVLLTTPNQYDLIVSEPSNPYRAGVANLFTDEYYAAAKKRLRPRGVFVQWLQGYEVDEVTVRTVFATLLRQFSNVEVWNGMPPDLMLVCRNDDEPYDWKAIESRLAQHPFKQGVAAAWNMHDIEGVAAHFVAGKKTVRGQAEQAGSHNTDDRNSLEYAFARTVASSNGYSAAQATKLFEIKELRSQALNAGDIAPPAIDFAPDPEQTSERRISMLVRRKEPFIIERLTRDKQARFQALNLVSPRQIKDALSDYKTAIALWESQPEPPQDAIQCTFAAPMFGLFDLDKMKKTVDRLKVWSPNDAALFEVVLRDLSEDHSHAANAKAIEVMAKLTSDPWFEEFPKYFFFKSILNRAKVSPEFCQKAYEALSKPLPGFASDRQRRETFLQLAVLLGPKATAEAFRAEEDFVDWSKPYLTKRWEAYKAVNDPLEAQAQRDLQEFTANEP
jgi:spermidine synthase